jgi:NAD-dependent deacetylase
MAEKKKIIVFTGAGISAESGLKTFRDSDGLWEEYNVMEVATPEAWNKNRELVLEFYNKRRKQIIDTNPNAAHYALAELEKKFDVHIITQNIDNLHERAGSKKVLHLHGEITKARSSVDPALIYAIKGSEIKLGQKCAKGSQLRPHIVWFGETVPLMEDAYLLASKADYFIIIGTSLFVYPAAGLVDYAPHNCPKYLIDPNDTRTDGIKNLTVIKDTAGNGVPLLVKKLLND